MTLSKLPALRRYSYQSAYIDRNDPDGELARFEDVEARERILFAEVERLHAHADAFAEVMAMIHGDGGHYLAKHGAAKAAEDAAEKHAKLRAEVEAMRGVLAKFDERWLMDGELGFCVACGVSIEGGEAHKPDCWLSEAVAARSAQ